MNKTTVIINGEKMTCGNVELRLSLVNTRHVDKNFCSIKSMLWSLSIDDKAARYVHNSCVDDYMKTCNVKFNFNHVKFNLDMRMVSSTMGTYSEVQLVQVSDVPFMNKLKSLVCRCFSKRYYNCAPYTRDE